MAADAGRVGDQIYRMEQITGLGAEALSGLRAISEESGESFDSLSGTLARAGKNIETAFINPTSEAGKVLTALFGKVGLESLQLEPAQKRIEDVTRKIFDLTDAAERDFAAATLFGKGWTENIETLKKLGTEGFDVAVEKAGLFGILMTQDEVRDAHDFNEMFKGVSISWDGFKEQIGQQFIPLFSLAIEKIRELKDSLDSLEEHKGVTVPDSVIPGNEWNPNEWKSPDVDNLAGLGLHVQGWTQQKQYLDTIAGLHVHKQHHSLTDLMANPPKAVKPDTSWMREVEEGLREINEQDRLYNDLVKELNPNQTALNKIEEQYFEVLAKIGEVEDPATRAMLSQLAAMQAASGIDKLFDQLPMRQQGGTFVPHADLVAMTQFEVAQKQAHQETIQWGADAFKFGEQFSSALTEMIIQGKGFDQVLESMIAYIAQAILKAYVFSEIWSSLGGAGGPLGTIGEFFGGMAAGRAVGGDVQPYTPYVVGEQGPELFVPQAAGNIVPNSKMTGGGDIIVNAPGADAGVEHRIMRAIPAAMAAAAANGMKMAFELQKRT